MNLIAALIIAALTWPQLAGLAFLALMLIVNAALGVMVVRRWLWTDTARQPDERADHIDYGGRDQWLDNLTLTESGRVELETDEQRRVRSQRERGQG